MRGKEGEQGREGERKGERRGREKNLLSKCLRMVQGPRNLYGRDGKFRLSFKSRAEKRRFSAPFLMT